MYVNFEESDIPDLKKILELIISGGKYPINHLVMYSKLKRERVIILIDILRNLEAVNSYKNGLVQGIEGNIDTESWLLLDKFERYLTDRKEAEEKGSLEMKKLRSEVEFIKSEMIRSKEETKHYKRTKWAAYIALAISLFHALFAIFQAVR